ncbi:MAG: type I DNA topoisomerase [Coprobacter sp.]|nr:type I DNA topoisomerase [Coprobacter sp.]
MSKNLVIVESPAKAKTIEKFLGKDFKVLSSYGHIRDLKKKSFSIDIEHDYAPIYEIPADKEKVVESLKNAARKAETVWIASDEDREGEAIAWHLAEVLGLQPETTRRIVFHEITQTAILEAIEHPRAIDIDRVNAQQARRILDRIVGFELSPVLWRKVKPALSAGRVQSVAVRLIAERENEIRRFTAENWFRAVATFSVPTENGGTACLKAELNRRLKNREEAAAFLEACRDARFSIADIAVRPARKTPPPPFTTSTLQQEAARKLGFSVAQTMMTAQRLYEAGFITYMRTDSVNLSQLALNSARKEIADSLGERYHKARRYRTQSKGAQEAHEAIRPTYIDRHAIEGTAAERRLYELIWKRTVASQMSDAELEKTTVTIDISSRDEKFVATGEVLTFDGYLKVYLESKEEEGDGENAKELLPPMSKGESLTLSDMEVTERFTQCPSRYTEASLVHKMEELGIGRPSTYAPTISTIQQREYVEKCNFEGSERQYLTLRLANGKVQEKVKKEKTGAEKGKLAPTDTGIVVNDYLVEFFPDIMDYNFTANVEQTFDDIAEGKLDWPQAIDRFYKLFHPVVQSALETKTGHKVGERLLGTDPVSGKPVSVKIGRFGPLVQIGSPEDAEKPRFASLLKGQSMATITLDEALSLFDLPRTLGDYEGKTVTVGIGKFGPYIRHDGKYVSLPKSLEPLSVSIDDAIALIAAKREEESQRHIKKFAEDADLEVLNGRYGPYIAYRKKNYKIPKGTDPKEISFESCMQLIQEADSKGDTGKKSVRRKKNGLNIPK